MTCPICSSPVSEPVPELFSLPNVTSDCRPWSVGRSVRICSGCGVMQRVISPLANFKDVYKDYTSYPEPQGRTEKILEFITPKIPEPKSILDIGTGTGAGIHTLEKHFMRALVRGYEPNSTNPDILSERADGKFDLITLFHVLEHVEDIHEMLEYVRGHLTENGHVLIQVPLNYMWPFDLVIADHCWHFTKNSIVKILGKCGFNISYIGNDIIRKELTIVSYSSGSVEISMYDLMDSPHHLPMDYLINYKKFLDGVNEQVAVMGTGPAAAWAGNILGDRVNYYIDDDKSRLGLFNDKFVYSTDHNIYIPIVAPFPDWQLAGIKKKYPSMRFL